MGLPVSRITRDTYNTERIIRYRLYLDTEMYRSVFDAFFLNRKVRTVFDAVFPARTSVQGS